MKYLKTYNNSVGYQSDELNFPRYNVSYLHAEDEVRYKKSYQLIFEIKITSDSTPMDRSWILPMTGISYSTITDLINSSEPTPATFSLLNEEVEETQVSEDEVIDSIEEDAIRKEYERVHDETMAGIPSFLVDNDYDYTVNWGDGSVNTYYSGQSDLSGTYHTYQSVGTYHVEIRGTFKKIYRNTGATNPYPTPRKLYRVISWGNTGLTSMNYAFANESNLYYIPLPPSGAPTFSQVTTFSYAFMSTGLTELPWNRVTGRGLFDECTKVRSFFECFYNCTKMTGEVPPGLFKNCTQVTDFGYVFGLCNKLSGVLPLGIFSYALNITSVAYAFYNCTNITGDLPEDMFVNNVNITNFESCFRSCIGLNGNIPSGIFRNCSKATMFRNVFKGSKNMVSVDYNLFEHCSSNNINLRSAFESTGLTEVPEGFLDGFTGTGIMYERMFYGCSKLTRIPSTLFRNITSSSDLVGAESMFAYCSQLTSLSSGSSLTAPTDNGVSQWSTPTLIKKWMGLFGECSSFDQLPNLQEELGGSITRLTNVIPGDIVLSDKTIVKATDYTHNASNPAIALVVDYDSSRAEGQKYYVMALNDVTKVWTPQSMCEDIPDLTNRTSPVVNTWKGKESTNIIKNYSGYTETKYPAVAYCVNYSTQGTNAGDWYLGDWADGWYAFLRRPLFEKSINKIKSEYPAAKAINYRDGTAYWTSNEFSQLYAGLVYTNRSLVSAYSTKWLSLYVRPCLSI